MRRLPFMALLLAPIMAIADPASAPKIREIKQANESLWQFLSALPSSMEAQILYGLVLAGTAGLLASWLWKYSNGQVGCLVDYLFREKRLRTLASVLSMVGGSLAAIAAGVFVTDSGEFVGWLNVLAWGANAGFGVDLAVNRGEAKPQ